MKSTLNLETLNDEALNKASECLKALAHPTRIAIIKALGDHELCVSDILEHTGTSQSNISQHLTLMKNKNILVCYKKENHVFYKVRDERVFDLVKLIDEMSCSV